MTTVSVHRDTAFETNGMAPVVRRHSDDLLKIITSHRSLFCKGTILHEHSTLCVANQKKKKFTVCNIFVRYSESDYCWNGTPSKTQAQAGNKCRTFSHTPRTRGKGHHKELKKLTHEVIDTSATHACIVGDVRNTDSQAQNGSGQSPVFATSKRREGKKLLWVCFIKVYFIPF